MLFLEPVYFRFLFTSGFYQRSQRKSVNFPCEKWIHPPFPMLFNAVILCTNF